jgi:SAM-dependent methyltransferase
MPKLTSLSIPNSLELYQDRAKNVDLIWCDQITNLLEEITDKSKKNSINDIGCNYGQVYKELKRKKLENTYRYNGYDIDDKFLDIARKHFPELKDKVQVLDIEKETPPSAEIAICSATFEHLDDPYKSLSNMFNSTTGHLILRTMIGSKDISFIQSDSKFVSQPVNINQFGLLELSQKFFDRGFNFVCIPDHATGMSKKYETVKGSGIIRQMYIILGSRTSMNGLKSV